MLVLDIKMEQLEPTSEFLAGLENFELDHLLQMFEDCCAREDASVTFVLREVVSGGKRRL